MIELLNRLSLKRILPIFVFATLIFGLLVLSLASLSNLLELRSTLVSESEQVRLFKERALSANGTRVPDADDYLIRAPSNGIAIAELQRQISEILSKTDADLQLTEVIPSDPDGDVGRLAIAINFEIYESNVTNVLFAIENAKPALLIERLSFRSLTNNQNAQKIRLQATATIVGAWKGVQ